MLHQVVVLFKSVTSGCSILKCITLGCSNQTIYMCVKIVLFDLVVLVKF
jgi:hypothetical protein